MTLFCFVGCSKPKQLNAPQIVLDEGNIIRWENSDERAQSYSVYVNGECVHGNIGSTETYYELDLVEEGVYTVYVVANDTLFYANSEKSNEIIIEIKNN